MRSSPATRWFINPHLNGKSFFWPGGEIGVLLIHGFTATTVEVQPLARFLHQQGITVAAPLLPGHGTNPFETNRTRWNDWLSSAASTLQALSQACRHVFIGGESMGGLLAVLLARQYPGARGLLLYAPAYHVPGLWRTRWLSLIVRVFPKTYTKDQEEEPYPWQGYGVVPLRAAAQLLKLQQLARREAPHITQPVLIFQGRLDRTIDPAGAESLYHSLGSSQKRLIWLENSRHCVLIDHDFDRVAHLTLEFIHQHIL